MYDFIITKKFLENQEKYKKNLNEKQLKNFENLKQIFIKDIFDKRLSTHKIYTYKNISVYSAYINKRDRIIFFFKNPKKIYLYKIMTDHDYQKLLNNIHYALNSFFDNF